MYELKDSYFIIIDPLYLIIGSSIIVLGSIGFLWMKANKRRRTKS